MAKINITRVSYKSTGTALNEVIGGHVTLMFPSAASALPHVKVGRLRALAVTSAQPSRLAPGLPPAALTVAGYEAEAVLGLFAPAKTPALLINRLNQDIVRVLNRADVKERVFNSGSEVVASSPAELTLMMKNEMARLGKVIKDAGIRLE